MERRRREVEGGVRRQGVEKGSKKNMEGVKRGVTKEGVEKKRRKLKEVK